VSAVNTFGKGVSFIRAPFIVIFRRFIALLCALALQTAAANAWVAPGSTVNNRGTDLGHCVVEIYSNASSTAYVLVDTVNKYSGGSYWKNGTFKKVSTLITNADLDTSCGLSSVTISSNIGADALSTYALETIMELVLRATEDLDGKTYDYVYRLSGAAGSVPVVTRTKTEIADNALVEDTQKFIATAMLGRINNLLGNQPSLSGFLQGGGSGGVFLNATDGQGFLSTKNAPDSPVWFRLKGAWSTSGTTSGSYAHVAAGSHYEVNSNFILGGMLQGDYVSNTDGAANSNGQGWLAGPYLAARHKTQPLYFDATLLYGQTYNNVSPLGTYSDSVSTERWMAGVNLTGEIARERITYLPTLGLSHAQDVQGAYTDGLGNSISSQGISLSEASLGIGFSTPVDVKNGQLTLTGGLSGIWSQSSGTGAAAGISPTVTGTRSRIDLGFSHQAASGIQTTFATYYDGLGVSNYEAFGASLKVQFSF
jgi:hypothetical protein